MTFKLLFRSLVFPIFRRMEQLSTPHILQCTNVYVYPYTRAHTHWYYTSGIYRRNEQEKTCQLQIKRKRNIFTKSIKKSMLCSTGEKKIAIHQPHRFHFINHLVLHKYLQFEFECLVHSNRIAIEVRYISSRVFASFAH